MSKKLSGELLLCGAMSPLIAFGLNHFYASPSLGQVIIALSLLFLVQTLLRDIWLYYRMHKATNAGDMSEIRGFCVETTVGVSVLILGFAVLFFSQSQALEISFTLWWILAMFTMGLCFWLRDYVFSWRPWRIYKDPDHSNLLFKIR